MGSKRFKQPFASIDIEGDSLRNQLPPIINEWLTSQRMTFFNGVDVQCSQDLLSALNEHCPMNLILTPSAGAMEMILALMNIQQVKIRSRAYIVKQSNQASRKYYSNFQEIPRKCDACGIGTEPDILPRFSIPHSGLYMARPIKCTSLACQGANRRGIPVDHTPWLRSYTKNEVTQLRLVRESKDCLELPAVVECWCVFCKEHTKLFKGQSVNKAIDANPQWTKGARPKYISRLFYCTNCLPKTHRFVPVNESISTIPLKDLSNFERNFSYMDEAALIAHLGARPSTSFQPRISVHRSNGGRKSQSLEPIVPAKPRSRTSSLAPDTVQKNLLVDSALVDLVVTDSSKPRIVPVKCDKCGQDCGDNFVPKWHRYTGAYVSTYRKGCPQKCTFKKVWLIPKDINMPFVRTTAIAAEMRSLENHLMQMNSPVLKLAPSLTKDELRESSLLASRNGQDAMEKSWQIESWSS